MKVNNTTKKHSIKNQLIIRAILVIVLLLLGTWILNVFLMEKLFTHKKNNQLRDVYNIMQEHSDSIENEKFLKKMNRMCSTYNIDFIIYNSSKEMLVSSIRDSFEIDALMHQVAFNDGGDDILGGNAGKKNYKFMNAKNKMNDVDYIVMYGVLKNGDFFLIRTAKESIKVIVRLINITMMIIVVVGLIISIAAFNQVARRIAGPITTLSDISKRMASFDFGARYAEKHNNEIDDLGENINYMSDRLEDNIKQLTQANIELKRDIEQKTKTDEMRKEFVGNISHELKTPIAIIRGYAEGLKEGVADDTESAEYYCDVIIDETNRMNKLVKQLITLTQLEYDSHVAELQIFDVIELINNCIEPMKLKFQDKKASVACELQDKVYVCADEYMIETVVNNYLSNALNHVREGGIIKIVTTTTNKTVKVSIYNDGDNIPEESLEYIWDKFYKVDKARSREYGGSGIGLSIVKAVMNSHQGRYGVLNKENGVEFWFELDLNLNTSCDLDAPDVKMDASSANDVEE